MERFKSVITTENKMLAYEFADVIGVADSIEEFYEFLSRPDKDGIIIYNKDVVRINKSKIMGALMLGDNSLLERSMARFRAWLLSVPNKRKTGNISPVEAEGESTIETAPKAALFEVLNRLRPQTKFLDSAKQEEFSLLFDEKCPVCGNIGITEVIDKSIVISYAPLRYGKKRHCSHCNHEWHKGEDPELETVSDKRREESDEDRDSAIRSCIRGLIGSLDQMNWSSEKREALLSELDNLTTSEKIEYLNALGISVEDTVAREKAKREAREKAEREKHQHEKEMTITILEQELALGHAIAVKDLVRLLDMDIDEAKGWLAFTNLPEGYTEANRDTLKAWAKVFLKALPEPTLLGVLKCPDCPSVQLAKAVGKYLVDERLVMAFPRVPHDTIEPAMADGARDASARPSTTPARFPIPFSAFQGSEPFVFASYAHTDKERVYPIIKHLHDAGARIWYDEGIPTTTIWKKIIAEKIMACSSFIVFLSPVAVTRKDVLNEISLAEKRYKKDEIQLVPLYLEDFSLTPELEYTFGRIQGLLASKFHAAELHDRLFKALSAAVKSTRS
jgi:hypothetical protein